MRNKRLKDILSSGDFPLFEEEEDFEVSEELIIDLDKLSESHDVIRIKMPSTSLVGEVDNGHGREIIVYRSLGDAAC